MLRISLFLSLVLSVYCQQCPNGFIRHNNSCYSVIFSPKSIWPEAQATCNATGTHLVTFETEAERVYVYQYIYSRYGSTHRYYWTGGLNYADGEWVWLNTLQSVNQRWAAGEPNRGSSDYCLLMDVTNHGFYADNDCENGPNCLNPFICEKDI